MEDALDRSNLAAMYSVWANYWLCIRVCIVTSFITLAVCVIGILGRDSLNTSLLGAALSSATSLASYATNVCDMLAQTELNAIAVERIQDYISSAKPETPMITDVRPPEGWPSQGRIEMKDVALRYRDGPLVLKGVNLTVEPGEKLILTPGESVCLESIHAHRFYGEPGRGEVLVGEVSMVNDDENDNCFLDGVIRFDPVEEDEPPERIPAADYRKFVTEADHA